MIVNLTNEKGIKLLTKDKLCKEDITIIPDLPGVGEDLADVLDAQEELIETLRTTLEGKAAGGGGGSMEGFHMVRFFNDDRTTLLYTVYVADGSSAIYAGDTPISTIDSGYLFSGFEPLAVNVTEDFDCYAVYEHFDSLETATWEQISNLSAKGTAENFFAVGDTKTIHIEGTVGKTAINGDYKVYIIGFNHNSEVEGEGITFGTFKKSNRKDIALIESDYTRSDPGTPFSMNPDASNSGGWMGCQLRYSALGSVDVKGERYASDTTATSPVANTLMAALPSDLRAVMKPMTIYTDNTGGTGGLENNVTPTTDYLPLLAVHEVFASASYANNYEKNKQKIYSYFLSGNSTIKYGHSDTVLSGYASKEVAWWSRSPSTYNSQRFMQMNTNGSASNGSAKGSRGVAPIFKV